MIAWRSLISSIGIAFAYLCVFLLSQAMTATSTVDNLRRYFETLYRESGEFQNEEYEDSKHFHHSWKHLRTGIVVWKDAIDLSAGPGAKAFFHYTGELAFRNIVALEKEAAEVWASLKTEGESANAWWGRGVYSVPKSPDQWTDQTELLDNNFRNMMKRDSALHGQEYVNRVYPPRASFCIPLLVDPENAYDIAVRPTPEMESAGKPPGTNLGGKLLNEPGQPDRCCAVLRVAGEHGVTNARARLLDALRAREASAQSPGLKIAAKARLGVALWKRGYFEESKILLSDVLDAREHTLGAWHPDTLASVNNLAGCLKDMGLHKDAEPLYRRDLEASERTLCDEHPDTLVSVNGLAACLQAMGRLKDAEPLYRRALEAHEHRDGAKHPLTLHSVNKLGACLQAMGRLKDAEPLYRRALEALESTLSDEHPHILTSVKNLAGCFQDMGRLKDAEPLYRRALEGRERTLGAEHPDTFVSVNDLAACFQDMDRLKDAEPLYRRALEARERTLGAEHPDTLASVKNLAGCFQAMGRLKDAEPLYRRALEARERTLGAEHPDTLVSVNDLAACFQDMGLLQKRPWQWSACIGLSSFPLKDAEPLYRRALEGRERTLGAEHPDTLASVKNLAGCFQAMGLLKDAEPLYRRALEARERTLGAEHPDTLVSVNDLAACFRDMGLLKDINTTKGTLYSCLGMFRRSSPSIDTE